MVRPPDRPAIAMLLPFLAFSAVACSSRGAAPRGGGAETVLLDDAAEVAGGAAVLHITRAGPRWYSVQLAFLPVRLRPGRIYQVTFRAFADRPIRTTFDLARVGRGWHSYSGRRELEISQTASQHEVRFWTREDEAEERARFEFNFGDEGPAVVRFDDVRVIEETPTGP